MELISTKDLLSISTLKNLLLILIVSITQVVCAQFAPSAGQTGSTAIKNSSSNIIGWATHCDVERGWLKMADTTLGKASFGIASDAIGSSNPSVVSLGDGGIAILSFDEPISNKEGFDFAVFENSFDDLFLELAHVEVSTDGINYVRFLSISNSQTGTQTGTFGGSDAAEIYNLAGKYRGQFGTPFDLEELKDSSKVNIDSINFVKIIDVVGSINPLFGSYDSEGNIINDPYPTDFESGGFDLDAVAVLDMSIEVNSISDISNQGFSIYPNPVNKNEMVNVSEKGILLNAFGQIIRTVDSYQFSVDELNTGLYFYQTENQIKPFIVR